jgi:hypothetical protein
LAPTLLLLLVLLLLLMMVEFVQLVNAAQCHNIEH